VLPEDPLLPPLRLEALAPELPLERPLLPEPPLGPLAELEPELEPEPDRPLVEPPLVGDEFCRSSAVSA